MRQFIPMITLSLAITSVADIHAQSMTDSQSKIDSPVHGWSVQWTPSMRQ